MNYINKIFFSTLIILSILPILNYAQNLDIPWEYDFNKYIIKNIGLGNERIKDSAIKSLTTSVINNSENTKTNAYVANVEYDLLIKLSLIQYNKSILSFVLLEFNIPFLVV